MSGADEDSFSSSVRAASNSVFSALPGSLDNAGSVSSASLICVEAISAAVFWKRKRTFSLLRQADCCNRKAPVEEYPSVKASSSQPHLTHR